MQPGQTWRCLLLQFVSGARRPTGYAASPDTFVLPFRKAALFRPALWPPTRQALRVRLDSGEIVHGRDYGTAGDAAKQ